MPPPDADAACHDLLVRLAGRIPDELLWRLREWLALSARTAVAGMLPRSLLRSRVGLDDDERALLATAIDGWGGSRRLLDAVPPLAVCSSDETAPGFRPAPVEFDVAGLTLLGIVRGHPGCRELARAQRLDGDRGRDVVLVRGGERPWALAGTLGRVLRAHGERTPRVEVLTAGPPTPYHRAALVAAASMWRADREPAGV